MTGIAIGSYRLLAILGAYILCDLLAIACPVAVHKTSAVMANHFSVKRMRLSPPIGITLNASPALLRIFKGFLVDDRLLRILECLPILLRYIVAFLVLKMLSGLEIDCMSQIFLSCEYGCHA